MRLLAEAAKTFIKEFAKKNKIKNYNDWYRVNLGNLNQDTKWYVYKHAWFELLNKDIVELLNYSYPKHNFHRWLFKSTPNGFWDIKENRIAYILWLEKKLKIKKKSDWYKVKVRKDVYKNKGVSLIKNSGSFYHSLRETYPDYDFKPWLFDISPQGYKKDKNKHKAFLDYICDKESINPKNDSIYSLDAKLIKKYGGERVLGEYKDYIECIEKNFPQIKLNRLKFVLKGRGFWKEKENHRIALLFLGQRLGFKKKKDWYSITSGDFENIGFYELLKIYDGSPSKACISILKEFKFDHTKFDFSSKYEFRARCYAKCLFGINDIIPNAKLDYLRFKKSGYKMELDIFIPSLKLAIEYNAQHHYDQSLFYEKKDFLHRKKLDKEKKLACKKNKIRLIIIKYSDWDGFPESFLKILKKEIRLNNRNISLFWRRLKKEDIFKEVLKEKKKKFSQ